jgi:hypothetical protein
MAIYADNAGVPGALLGESANQSSVIIGENDYPLLVPVSVLLGQKIWIAVLTSASISWALTSSTAGSRFNSNLFANGFSNPFGASSVDNKKAPIVAYYLTAANATLSPSLVVDSETYYSPLVTTNNAIVETAIFVDTDFYYQPVVSTLWTILPNGYDDSPNDVIYAPIVTPGEADILPGDPFIDFNDVFYSPTVTPVYPLVPILFVDTDSVYQPVITQPFVTLLPSLYDDSVNDAALSPVVTNTPAPFQSLTPSLYDDSANDAWYVPVITLGAAVISPPLSVDSDTFYAPMIGFTLFSSRYIDSDIFFGPAVSRGQNAIDPLRLRDDLTDAIYGPTITSSYDLAAGIVVDNEVYFSPSVAPGDAFVYPDFYTDDRDQFWEEVITQPSGEQDLSPAKFQDTDVFYSPLGVAKDQFVYPMLVVDIDYILPTGNIPLRHRIPVSGDSSEVLQTLLGDSSEGQALLGDGSEKLQTLLGDSSEGTEVDGNDDRELEVLGEV